MKVRGAKNLRQVRSRIRELIGDGRMEPEQVDQLTRALGSFEHALAVRDEKGIWKAVDKIASVFLRTTTKPSSKP